MRRGSIKKRSAAALLACLLATGCKVGPEYQRPFDHHYLEASWSQAPNPRLTGQPLDISQWWDHFDDPQLNHLVEMAVVDNLGLKEAGKRVLEAQALRKVAAGSLFPQQQSLNASYSNLRISQNVANFVTVPGFFETDRVFDLWTSSLGLTWELDFWGRLRRTVEVADAQVDQSMAAYDLVKVVMLAELARTYIEMRTVESRIELVHKNIEIQKKLVELTEKRLQEGLGNKLDYHQAASNLAKVQAILPNLEILRRQSSNRICVLLGCAPTDIQHCLGQPGIIPTPPPEIAVGVPCDLLRRRPDVQVAERQLAAQSAKIGIAQADFYPQIALTGQIGLQSQNLSSLFQTPSLVGAIGPGFQWNILNYGRIKNRVVAEREGFERLCFAYHDVVLKAYQEVEDAQVAYLNGFDRLAAISQYVDDARTAAEIALAAFEEGSTDFDRVLQLQSQAVLAEDEQASVRGELAISLVKFYLAMGGGWSISGPEFCTANGTEYRAEYVAASGSEHGTVPSEHLQAQPPGRKAVVIHQPHIPVHSPQFPGFAPPQVANQGTFLIPAQLSSYQPSSPVENTFVENPVALQSSQGSFTGNRYSGPTSSYQPLFVGYATPALTPPALATQMPAGAKNLTNTVPSPSQRPFNQRPPMQQAPTQLIPLQPSPW